MRSIVPFLERKEVAPLLRFFPDATELTVFDVGAHKGLWTRALLNVFSDRIAQVHMFDPSPENQRELGDRKDNFAGLRGPEHDRLRVNRCGLGRTHGTATLYTNEDGSPLSSLYSHEHSGWGELPRLSQEIEVQIDTIDRVVERSGVDKINILKIDTEGHEMEVLLGGEHTIGSGKVDLVTFEFGTNQVESRRFFRDFWLYLTNRGFAFYYVNASGELLPIERYEYRWERFDANYIFIASRIPAQGA